MIGKGQGNDLISTQTPKISTATRRFPPNIC